MNNYNDYTTFNNMFLVQDNLANNIYGPYEGYLKGNLFKNLYEEYGNYKPNNIKINNEKEESLFNLNQICFALHEINLYLDVFPNDREALNIFSNYEKMYNSMLSSYQEKYGPINVNSVNGNDIPFSWVSGAFPWEVM